MASGHYPATKVFPGRYVGPGDGSFPGRYPDYSTGTSPVPPGTPALWYAADNIDALNNTSLVDGQNLGTWKNLGSLGSAADCLQATAGAKPFYRAIAGFGKLNNKPGVQGDGARWMQSGAIAAQVQPGLVGLLCRSDNTGVTAGWLDGRAAGGRFATYHNATGQINFDAGGGVATNKSVISGDFHVVIGSFNGANSFSRVDGSQSANVNPGTNSLGGVTLMGLYPPSNLINGFLVEALVYSDAGATTPAQIESYFLAKYGATPA